jgi:hypothetical protein
MFGDGNRGGNGNGPDDETPDSLSSGHRDAEDEGLAFFKRTKRTSNLLTVHEVLSLLYRANASSITLPTPAAWRR